MAIQRKCPNCGLWNNDEDSCVSCGTLLSPKLIEEEKEKKREERRNSIQPTKLDIFIEKWENSRFWVLRILYKVLYTIAMIFFSIAAFFAWLATAPNG